jgi:hypothetical protein
MQSSYQGAVDLHGEEEEFGNLRAEVLCHLNGGGIGEQPGSVRYRGGLLDSFARQ